jgi:hypothetical protein
MANENDQFSNAIADSLGMQVVSENEQTQEQAPQPEPKVETTEQTAQTETVAASEADNSSEPTTETAVQESTEQPVVNEPAPAVDTFAQTLAEKTGGKYNSWDEIEQALQPAQPTEMDEKLMQLNDYLNKGGSFEDFVVSQTTDYNELNEIELVAEQMLLDNPDLSEEDVSFLLENKYKLDADKYEETDVRLAKIQLKQDANAAKQKLSDFQKKYSLPVNQEQVDYKKELEARQQQQQEAAAVQREKWLGDVDKTIPSFQKMSFKIGDEEVSHTVTDEQRGNIKNLNSDLNTFFNKYVEKDGTTNFQLLHEDRYKLEYFDDILRSAVTQARSKGTEAIVDKIKNPSTTVSSKDGEARAITVEEQVRRQFLG